MAAERPDQRPEQSPASQLARGELKQAEVRALDLSGIPSVLTGIGLWAVTFVVLLFFRGDLDRADREWWLWVAVAGVGLGVLGLWYCRRRWAAIQRDQSTATASETASETAEGSSSS